MRLDKDNSIPCDHEFAGGLCTHCLCPQTKGDARRSINAIENAAALTGHYSEVLGRFVTRDDAVLQAWRSHARQAAKG